MKAPFDEMLTGSRQVREQYRVYERWLERQPAEIMGSRRDEAYDVPSTTLHVGTIRGGTALNIVPRDCEFVFEVRHLPFDDPDELFAEVRDFAGTFVPAMRAVAPDAHIAFDALSTMPGFDTQDGSAIAALGHELCCTAGAGKVSFGTGVERTFPLHSPIIEKIEVERRGDVRRAKLYYLRGLRGKAAKIKEKRDR